MRKTAPIAALLVLLQGSFACGLPLLERETQAGPSLDVQQAAAQTIAAQQTGMTATAFAQGTAPAAISQPEAAAASQTALSFESTRLSQAAGATASAQALAATVAAFDAQATAIAQSKTDTAQAHNPPAPPLPPPPGSMTRISFARGATSAVVEGQIRKDSTIDYVARAGGGQTMLVSVFSTGENVYLGIVGLSDGVPLMRSSAAGTTFTGVLPATQDYRITLFSPHQKSSYALQVIIPARIQFAVGAVTASIPGYLRGSETNFYLAHARRGQLMSVSIDSPGDDIFLTVYGMEDGSPLVRSVMAQTSWSGDLPATQDYMIQAVSTGSNADYTLRISIQ